MTDRNGSSHGLGMDCCNALRLSYEEELVGASFFAQLSSFHSGSAYCLLLLFTQIELIMADALRALVSSTCTLLQRRTDTELHQDGIHEANELRNLHWSHLASHLATTFLPAISDIAQIQSQCKLADKKDKAVLQQFLEHELLIVAALQGQVGEHPGVMLASSAGWISRHGTSEASSGVGKFSDDACVEITR